MRESQNLQKYQLCRVGRVLVEKESPSGALASLLVDESSLRSAPGNPFGKHSFEPDLSFAGRRLVNLESKASRSHITVSFVTCGFCFLFMKKERRSFQTVAAYFGECVFQNVSPNTKRGVQHLHSASPNFLRWDGGPPSPKPPQKIHQRGPTVGFSPAPLSVGLWVSEGHPDH